LQRLTELDPTHEHGWLWRANVAETSEEAVAYLQQVLEINPDNVHAQDGIRWHRTSPAAPPEPWQCPLCGAETDEPPNRCPDCHALQSLDDRAALLKPYPVNRKQLEVTVVHYQNLLPEQPDAAIHFYLALALANLQQFGAAVEHLHSAVHLDPSNEILRKQMAVLTDVFKAFETAHSAAADEPRKTVLIVDDSATIRKLVSLTMEKAGYRVVPAADGQEALELIRQQGVPHLLIVDSVMPGMDGYEVCKVLKQTALTQHVPVVMLTCKDNLLDKMR